MSDIITGLTFPIVLSVIGALFVLLGIAGNVELKGIVIKMPPGRQKGTTVFGIILVLIGVVVYVLPGTKPTPTSTPSPEQTATSTPTQTPSPTTPPAPAPTPVPSAPTHTPTPTPFTITNLNWEPCQEDGKGSSISVEPVSGTNDTIRISFNLEKSGWVATYKKLNPELLSQTNGIRFLYTGTGAPNTLELKLIERDETIFEVVWYHQTSMARTSWEVLYGDFKCRKDSGRCLDDKAVGSLTFDPENVDRIDFAFSNKPDHGDVPGSGEVIIEKIQIVP